MGCAKNDNFNSIKVRLKRLASPLAPGPSSFQFHKGTIETIISVLFALCLCNFNSIKVRLKHPEVVDYVFDMSHFNSIKVRLKPELRLIEKE